MAGGQALDNPPGRKPRGCTDAVSRGDRLWDLSDCDVARGDECGGGFNDDDAMGGGIGSVTCAQWPVMRSLRRRIGRVAKVLVLGTGLDLLDLTYWTFCCVPNVQ
jgi:hypothetical protein